MRITFIWTPRRCCLCGDSLWFRDAVERCAPMPAFIPVACTEFVCLRCIALLVCAGVLK